MNTNLSHLRVTAHKQYQRALTVIKKRAGDIVRGLPRRREDLESQRLKFKEKEIR